MHGIKYATRENDIFEIYEGSASATDLMRRYRINFVLIELDKIADFRENVWFFSTHFPLVYNSPNYIVFQVPQQHIARQILPQMNR